MKRTRAPAHVALLVLVLTAAGAGIQPQDPEILAVPFDSPRWTIDANEHRIEEHLGRRALRLKGGTAVLDDADFLDGVIEFDVAFEEDPGFPGVFWRRQDEDDYEEFYFRPHQSGNPDANQYTPVFNGVSGWQLYHGEGYGSPVTYRYDGWMHVRIVVSGDRAEVYIDSEEPVLAIDPLKREAVAGGLALGVPDRAPAWYANFEYRRLAEPGLRSAASSPPPTPPGTVTNWEVSTPFDEATLDGVNRLQGVNLPDVEWKTLAAEPGGITNLARLAGVSDTADTVFARVVLRSDRDRVVKAAFGYSDRVRVYFNDRLVYSGDNGYQTRDYRYLGTMGLFDEVWLRLERGDNEMWFAVSENFGGWGIVCRLESLEGVEIVTPAGPGAGTSSDDPGAGLDGRELTDAG